MKNEGRAGAMNCRGCCQTRDLELTEIERRVDALENRLG
jgi:hypothetical protein